MNKTKELLLKDLSARLPYGVKGKLRDSNYTGILKDVRYSCFYPLLVLPLECPLMNDECTMDVNEFKPYLRPMSSMTKVEYIYFMGIRGRNLRSYEIQEMMSKSFSNPDRIATVNTLSRYSHNIDWLNKNMFDYRGLIDKGLALEAPKDMYNLNK